MYRNKFQDFICWRVDTGDMINFWCDAWLKGPYSEKNFHRSMILGNTRVFQFMNLIVALEGNGVEFGSYDKPQ